MKLTNLYGLPEPIIKKIEQLAQSHRGGGDYSVTELVAPPRITQLKRRHDNEIIEDASDRLWMLAGSAMHEVLEGAKIDNAFQEEWLSLEIEGIIVTGIPDWYSSRDVVADYKFTSVWAIIEGLKSEWEAQVNCYAYMYRTYGFPVKGLEINAFLHDWRRGEAKRGGNYPPIPFVRLAVPDWGEEKQLEYFHERLGAHEIVRQLPDDDLPICAPEERWEKSTSYAVMKGKNKGATRVCTTLVTAEEWLKQGKEYRIEERPGESVRCAKEPNGYCGVSQFCNWGRNKEEGGRMNDGKNNDG